MIKYLFAKESLQDIPKVLTKGPLTDLAIATILINLLALALPLTMMQIYDRIIANASMGTLFWIASGCIIAFLMESILKLARHHITNWAASRFEKGASFWALNRLLFGVIDRSINLSVPLNLERIQAIGQLRNFYSGQVFQTFLDFPFVLLFLAVIFLINKQLAWVLLIFIVLFLFSIFILSKFFKNYKSNQDDHNRERHDYILTSLEKLHLIKTFSLEERILRRYENLQSKCAQSNIVSNFWSEFPNTSGSFLSQLSLFSMVGLGAWLVIKGQMSVGGLTAIMIITGRVMQPVQNLGALGLRLTEIERAQNKLLPLKDIPLAPFSKKHDSHALSAKDINGHLVLKDVNFAYNTESTTLNDVNLELNSKSLTIIDKNESVGATTLLLLMARLINPTKGELFIDSVPLQSFPAEELRGLIEYVPTQGVIFKGSIRDNLCMFDQGPNSYSDAAAMLGLDDWVAELPMGYETLVENNANNLLPRGAIQRIIIARALIYRPRILLLDNPDHSMDLESFAHFKWLLSKLKGVCTVVLVTKNTTLFPMADQIITIKNGWISQRKPL